MEFIKSSNVALPSPLELCALVTHGGDGRVGRDFQMGLATAGNGCDGHSLYRWCTLKGQTPLPIQGGSDLTFNRTGKAKGECKSSSFSRVAFQAQLAAVCFNNTTADV